MSPATAVGGGPARTVARPVRRRDARGLRGAGGGRVLGRRRLGRVARARGRRRHSRRSRCTSTTGCAPESGDEASACGRSRRSWARSSAAIAGRRSTPGPNLEARAPRSARYAALERRRVELGADGRARRSHRRRPGRDRAPQRVARRSGVRARGDGAPGTARRAPAARRRGAPTPRALCAALGLDRGRPTR